MRGIRQPNVKNLQELDTLEPKDKWIVRVEDEDSDFYYDTHNPFIFSFKSI